MAEDNDRDYVAPPHLCIPDGTPEEQNAWIKAQIAKGMASPLRHGTVDELFDRVIRRGHESLAKPKRAA